MPEFRGTKQTDSYTMRINAAPAAVFPLLCPEREKEWLDGWDYEMIHSRSGYAEPGCTFRTDLPPEGEAYWLMTRHLPPHEAEYVRFVPGLMFVVLSLRLTARDGGTDLFAACSHTAVSPRGNSFLASQTADQIADRFRRLESALNHFLATGAMLKNPR